MRDMSDVPAAVMTLPPELWLGALVIVVAARQLVPLLAIFLPEKLAARAERVLRIQRGQPDAHHGGEAAEDPEVDPERHRHDT
jgi:hypothetical protein